MQKKLLVSVLAFSMLSFSVHADYSSDASSGSFAADSVEDISSSSSSTGEARRGERKTYDEWRRDRRKKVSQGGCPQKYKSKKKDKRYKEQQKPTHKRQNSSKKKRK